MACCTHLQQGFLVLCSNDNPCYDGESFPLLKFEASLEARNWLSWVLCNRQCATYYCFRVIKPELSCNLGDPFVCI